MSSDLTRRRSAVPAVMATLALIVGLVWLRTVVLALSFAWGPDGVLITLTIVALATATSGYALHLWARRFR